MFVSANTDVAILVASDQSALPGFSARRPCSLARPDRNRAQPPSGPQEATQRPPGADHLEVDVGTVTGDDVTEVFRVFERQDGEVIQGIALGRLGPVNASDLIAFDEHVGDLEVAVGECRRSRPKRDLGYPAVVCDYVGGATPLLVSAAHLRLSSDACASRLRPGHGGSGASCSFRMVAPAAAHAAGDAVDGSPRRRVPILGRAASASTGGLDLLTGSVR